MSKFFKTPKAVAGYAHVNRPSKFKKFELTFRFKDESEVKEIVEAVKELVMDTFGPKKASKAKLPFGKDDESGDFTIKATSNFKPRVYNAKGALIDEERVPAVYGGSVVKGGIKFETYDRDGKYGVTARLKSVQVIKLVSDTGGFDDESEDDEEAYTEDGVEPVKQSSSKSAAHDAEEDAGDEDDATSF